MQQDWLWVIVGVHGLYTGSWETRVEAIAGHVEARQGVRLPIVIRRGRGSLTKSGRNAWAHCRRKGDRAVLATINWE